MIDSEFPHCRMSACTLTSTALRIVAVSINTKASIPAFLSTEPTTLLGTDTPQQHANPKPTI
jgi:hypothetical protein